MADDTPPKYDLEADPLDQFGDRKAITRHDGAELMARRSPADVAAFEHGDARPQPGRFQRDGQARKPRADDADIDVEVEGQPRAVPRRCGGI